MDNIHLVGEDDNNDLYTGFNDYNATLDTENLENDTAFQQAVRTSHGRRPPPTAARIKPQNKGMPPSSFGNRLGTAAQQDPLSRPMTAVRAAGYNSTAKSFDPLNQSANKGPAPPLDKKNEDLPEEKIKLLERKVNQLIEDSCVAHSKGNSKLALEKAKEAGRQERILNRHKEAQSSSEQVNLDLTYSVLFNLASQYSYNGLSQEAINTYLVIVKNKMFSNAGRLKVNMGNIYLRQKNFSKAIKYYRMALDQVPNTHKYLRIKIMENIGIAFVKIGQYLDAITSFEHIMKEDPNFKTGFNLILCYFAMGYKEKMKDAFNKLLTVDLKIDDEDKYISSSEDKQYNLLLEEIKNDSLRQIEKKKKAEALHCIKMAAKIIAPAIESSYSAGYDWCIDQVLSSNYMDLGHDLEIDKAIGYLKQKDFNQAVETLKSFEKKDTKVASTAATNLSFLFFLESELNQADKYSELALSNDRYNPSALVNRGNTLFVKKDYEKAREYYKEALQNDSSCVEALYNLGLCHKRLNQYDEALDQFYKLHAIMRNNAQVFYQIADLHDLKSENSEAIEWFMQLLGVVPSDAAILSRLGHMYEVEGDQSQAFQYYYDSYRYNPSNISVIEWLGAYFIDSQFCEKAIPYFERACLIQPAEVKWHLMVASCHRRSGNYPQALQSYKIIHKKFPENIECLRFLVRICTDLGMKESQEYAVKLKKAEKQEQLRQDRINSGTRRGSGRRRPERENSAGSDSSSVRGGNRETSAGSRKFIQLDDSDEPYQITKKSQPDSSYSDPLGPQVERPKTAARRKDEIADEFADEELGEDLLPE